MKVTIIGKIHKVYVKMGEIQEYECWWEESCKRKKGVEIKKQKGEGLGVKARRRRSCVWGPGHKWGQQDLEGGTAQQ